MTLQPLRPGPARPRLHKPATRAANGTRAQASGLHAEALAEQALLEDGWHIIGRRVRTPAGELDLIAEKNQLLAFIEVKHRPNLTDAASALGQRQRQRLLAAATYWCAHNPNHGQAGIRFDLIAVNHSGQLHRIQDALRET